MAKFWLSKRTLLEALKLSEGLSQSAFVCFEGRSEVKNDREYTCTTITVNGRQKVLKEDFEKLLLSNGGSV